LLDFPPAIATSTSTFILLFTSLSATVTHGLHGDFHGVIESTALVAVGMVLGAQIGARVSQRVSGRLLVRLLALALAFVGARLLLGAA
ncbi:MAG: TSUP family transporter, partial [Chloroflexota bacterium]